MIGMHAGEFKLFEFSRHIQTEAEFCLIVRDLGCAIFLINPLGKGEGTQGSRIHFVVVGDPGTIFRSCIVDTKVFSVSGTFFRDTGDF